jgi:hypothetical protein
VYPILECFELKKSSIFFFAFFIFMGYNFCMADDRRKDPRFSLKFSSFIRKVDAEGQQHLMCVDGKDLSLGGAFLTTESLAFFDVGDMVDLMVDLRGEAVYDGSGRIVRSEDEGYGIMFLQPSKMRAQIDSDLFLYQGLDVEDDAFSDDD